MKKLIFILVLAMSIHQARAQKIIEKHIDFSQKTNVVLNLQIADSIKISTWNKNEVYAKASVNINENKDNEAYLTSFEENGKDLKIDAHFKKDYINRKNNCLSSEITWEVFIPENIFLSVETINGNIIIEGKTSDIKVHAISGFVDLAVPSNKKADLCFKTISGTIFSNHNFASNSKGNSNFPKVIERMNGGGSSINLETISGNIFFRELK